MCPGEERVVKDGKPLNPRDNTGNEGRQTTGLIKESDRDSGYIPPTAVTGCDSDFKDSVFC